MEIDYEEHLKPVVGKPKLGDTLLLALCGIWTITYIDKNGNIWCGGLSLNQTLDEDQRIIPEEIINKLKEIEVKFKEGDYVEGLSGDEFVKGFISDIHWTSIEEPIWIKCDITGYTRPLLRESVKHSTANFAFTEWFRILKRKII